MVRLDLLYAQGRALTHVRSGTTFRRIWPLQMWLQGSAKAAVGRLSESGCVRVRRKRMCLPMDLHG